MSSLYLRPAFLVFALIAVQTASLAADDIEPTYKKGSITVSGANPKSYDLKGDPDSYQISHCGDFQNGQNVDYRLKEDKVYINREGAKEYKCSIEATMTHWSGVEPGPITYQKGTIEGFETRRDTSIGGGGGGGSGLPGMPVSSHTRIAKVYRLRGTDLIYKVDYCGAFQAGQFTTGQVVEYRVVDNRVLIRHDNNKDYSCQLEGTERPGPVASSSMSAPAAAATAPSTAHISVTSMPDGADIEVDGNFSGNTPSDLKIPEGDHVIAVKKSGYKTWERKMKLVAGSSIHLNAEMEKTTSQ